jgi:hypothetical protein
MSEREVTREEFFAKVGPMDVNPRASATETVWETPRREVVGRSTPGYRADAPKRWFLV